MAKVMTKSQVVSHLAEKSGLQKKATAELLENLVTLATKECKSNGQFVVPGLGKAVKAHRKERVGRNPQTGAAIKIPASEAACFSSPSLTSASRNRSTFLRRAGEGSAMAARQSA